jgi:hypothetical protein
MPPALNRSLHDASLENNGSFYGNKSSVGRFFNRFNPEISRKQPRPFL